MALGIGHLYGANATAFNAPLTRLNIFDGAVRSGKTTTALLRWAKWVAKEAPPGTLMIAGKTERTVKQNMVDPLYDIFGKRFVRYSAGNHELWLMGRRHIIVGANDERSESKIRGITLAGVLGDELSLWAESFFKMTLSRMSVADAMLLGTTNPDSPVHWLNAEYLSRADALNLTRHRFRLYDNPHLPEDFVRSIEAEYVGLWRKRFIDGEWAVAEGAVYDMFNPDVHVVPDLDVSRQNTLWRAHCIDYGTTNPTVFLSISLQKEPRRLIVHDEWRWDSKKEGHQMTAKEYSEAYRDWAGQLQKRTRKADRVFIDPSANHFIIQLYRDGEHYARGASNDVLPGIMAISSLLQAHRLVFHGPTTRQTVTEMAGYSWDDEASQRGEERPIKTADHGPDALRYGIYGTSNRWRVDLTSMA